jgi:hypothetical protein
MREGLVDGGRCSSKKQRASRGCKTGRVQNGAALGGPMVLSRWGSGSAAGARAPPRPGAAAPPAAPAAPAAPRPAACRVPSARRHAPRRAARRPPYPRPRPLGQARRCERRFEQWWQGWRAIMHPGKRFPARPPGSPPSSSVPYFVAAASRPHSTSSSCARSAALAFSRLAYAALGGVRSSGRESASVRWSPACPTHNSLAVLLPRQAPGCHAPCLPNPPPPRPPSPWPRACPPAPAPARAPPAARTLRAPPPPLPPSPFPEPGRDGAAGVSETVSPCNISCSQVAWPLLRHPAAAYSPDRKACPKPAKAPAPGTCAATCPRKASLAA